MTENEHIPAYPLQWPAGWRRHDPHQRTRAKFNKRARQHSAVTPGYSWVTSSELSIAAATQRLMETLERMNLHPDDVVLSTDLMLRLDGYPRSSQKAPDDPGVSVYWRKNKETRCMAIDRYDRLADNIAAVAATLEAMRSIERHGGAEILDRAFTGFVALPAPAQWWHVLGFDSAADVNWDSLHSRYRQLALERHPDKGGNNDAMAELTWARDQGREHCRPN